MFHYYKTPTEERAWQDGEDVTVPADATFTCDWDGQGPLSNVVGVPPAGGIPFAGWPQA